MQITYSIRNRNTGKRLCDIITTSAYKGSNPNWLYNYYIHCLNKCQHGFNSESEAINAAKKYMIDSLS